MSNLPKVLYKAIAFCLSFFLIYTSEISYNITPNLRNLGQRGEAQVGLDGAEVGEELLGLLVLDDGGDDDVVTGLPVDRGGDAVLVAGLEGVDDAQDLVGVAAGGGRVGQDGADLLVGVDEEDGADGEGDALFVDVGGVLAVDPVCIWAMFSW
jgi:hypothetical protein